MNSQARADVRDVIGAPPSTDTIMLRGTQVPVVHSEVDQAKLRFYEANPRIYSMVRKDGKVPGQSEIQEHLLAMDHVKGLIQDIRRERRLDRTDSRPPRYLRGARRQQPSRRISRVARQGAGEVDEDPLHSASEDLPDN